MDNTSDDMCTPLHQLRPMQSGADEPIPEMPNYNDLVQNINDSPQVMQRQPAAPPPALQHLNQAPLPMQRQDFRQSAPPQRNIGYNNAIVQKKNSKDDMYRDVVIIFVLYVIINSGTMQEGLIKTFLALQGESAVLRVALNGAILAGALYVSKNVNISMLER